MPKVSVIIPTHNRPDLIGKAIQSVLKQTYQDFEIIVVDDGLEKRAEAEVKKIKDERIRYIQHEKESGGGAARNTGIKAARGEYIAFLDDDDEWMANKLELQVQALEQSPVDVSTVFCGVEIIDKTGKLKSKRISGLKGICQPYEKTLGKCFIWTSAMMYRRSYADKGFIFDPALKKNQEWDLQLRLLKVSKFYALNEALAKIIELADGKHMGGKGNTPNMILGMETFIKKHYNEYIVQPKFLALRYLQLASLYRENNDFTNTRRHVFMAWKLVPWNLAYLRHLLALLLGKSFYNKLHSTLRQDRR